jgi:MFS family permease
MFGWGNMMIVPAFPSIADAFGISAQTVSLVMAFYALPGIALSPVYGVISDRVGRRKVLFPTMVIFLITGIGAGVAPDFTMILMFRLMQGVVTAAFFPMAFIILGDLFTGETRTRAVSQSFVIIGVISILIPFLSGWLTIISWRLTFLSFTISLPIIIAFYYLVPETHPMQVHPTQTGNPEDHRLSPTHSEHKNEAARGNPDPHHSTQTLHRVSWFAITGIMLMGVCYFLVVFGSVNLFRPFYVEDGLGLTAVETGVISSAQNFVTTSTVLGFSGVGARRSKPWILFIGFSLIGGGCVGMMFPPQLIWLLVTTVVIGVGKGVTNPALNSYTLDLTSPRIRGRVTALFQSMARIGQSAGPYLFSTAYVVLGEWLAIPFWLGAIMCGVAVIIVVPMIRYTNRTGVGKPISK